MGQRSGSLDGNLWAYLAGIVDGEGYVTIKRSGTLHEYKDKSYCYKAYSPVIAIAMTDQKFIVWMKEITNIKGQLWVRKFPNPRWRPSYTLSFHGANAIQLAKNILPYSRIKKPQLEILMKYPIGDHRRSQRLKRDNLYWEMREVNLQSRHQQRLSEETLKHLNSRKQQSELLQMING